MDIVKRPENMQRITTNELAQVFIDEQVQLVKEQVKITIYKQKVKRKVKNKKIFLIKEVFLIVLRADTDKTSRERSFILE